MVVGTDGVGVVTGAALTDGETPGAAGVVVPHATSADTASTHMAAHTRVRPVTVTTHPLRWRCAPSDYPFSVRTRRLRAHRRDKQDAETAKSAIFGRFRGPRSKFVPGSRRPGP